MRLDRVPVDHIDIPPRLRAVDDAKVKQLAESMDALGLQTPITIHQDSPDQGGFDLITGAHRLGAAKLLDWEWIDVVFTDADEIDRQLWEIDENLMRSELTPTQMAEHLAKRKELWEAREVSGQVVSKPQGGRPEGFATNTEKSTGVSRRQINRSVARVDQICDEARDVIRGTKLDTGVFLDRLKGVPIDEQAEFAQRHLERIERPSNVQQLVPEPENDFAVKERQVSALMAAWNKAGREAREEFLSRVENPVMDERYG